MQDQIGAPSNYGFSNLNTTLKWQFLQEENEGPKRLQIADCRWQID